MWYERLFPTRRRYAQVAALAAKRHFVVVPAFQARAILANCLRLHQASQDAPFVASCAALHAHAGVPCCILDRLHPN